MFENKDEKTKSWIVVWIISSFIAISELYLDFGYFETVDIAIGCTFGWIFTSIVKDVFNLIGWWDKK